MRARDGICKHMLGLQLCVLSLQVALRIQYALPLVLIALETDSTLVGIIAHCLRVVVLLTTVHCLIMLADECPEW